jgi:hypothetical protein
MNYMNRRNALKALGGLPLAVSLANHEVGQARKSAGQAKKITKVTDKTPCLNIILHGMFALDFTYQSGAPVGLVAYPPKVYGHTYGAGEWRKETFLDQEDGTYTLKNAKATTPMSKQKVKQLDGALISWQASKITGIQAAGTDLSPYCSMKLGIPDDVWTLRSLVRTASDDPFFEGQCAVDNQLDQVTRLPLIHVLNYTNVDPTNPPGFADWVGKPGAAFWNLHIIAEPSFSASPGHLSHGLEKMCKMYTATQPLDLRFKKNNNMVFSAVPTDLSTGHTTVMEQEEEALEEIRAGIIVGTVKTSKVHNCMKIVSLNDQ